MIKKQPHMNAGAAVLFVIFSLLFFILIFRFVTIQVTGEVHGQALAARAQQKYSNERVIEAVRGTIFDRKGEVVAEDTSAYTLVAILDASLTSNKKKPMHVKDPEMTAKKLSKYIDMSESEIYKRLTMDKKQIEFGKAGRDISHQTKSQIEKLKLPGITFLQDSKRFYPNGIFSSHLVGFVEKEETEDGKSFSTGKLGIEKTLNDQLTGKNGSLSFDSDLWGFLLPNGEKKITQAQDGNNVYLTIDKKIQTFVEDAVDRVDEEFKPKNIIVVVADPKTGDILAMSQRPTFHPTTREGLENSWHNDVIEKPIEPGSTMKIFTLAAAVEEKKFNPNETYKSGTYKVTENSGSIGDHNNREGWGTITYLEGIQRSSNVAVARLVNEKIGTEKFREYLTKFGFDQPTGIDLPNESVGKILYQWPIEKITTSYGQGSTVTPIQLVQAATAVANDGKMMKPRVIDKIVNPNTGKIVKQSQPESAGQPISAESAKEVRDVLETVITSEHGTGKSYAIEGYQVAGKTGTANLTKNGQYLHGASDYLFSFIGMAPKDDPKLVVYVAVQQPEIDHYFKGSIPVSTIFKSVMKSSLQYLNIKPASMEKAESSAVPDVTGMDLAEARKLVESKGFETVVIGTGNKADAQLPKADTVAMEGEKLIIRTSGVKTYPDLAGWSLRDVMKLAQIADINLNKAGSGYVIKQNLQPGSPITAGENLIIELETPLQQFEKSQKAEENSEETEEAGG